MTSVSQTVSIDKLADILNKYRNTCSTIKMKPVIKILNLKLVIKSILLKPTFQIGLKKFL